MSEKKANWTKRIAIGCGGLIVLTIIGFLALAKGCSYLMKDVEGVTVTVKCPGEILKDAEVDLTVTVTNQREGQDLKVAEIMIANEFMDGFLLVSTDPAVPSTTDITDTGLAKSVDFGVTIAPGDQRIFNFRLRAERVGIFKGDVDVYEGMRCITQIAQAVVKEKQE